MMYFYHLESYWLNGHMDPACVSAGTCTVGHIVWEDGGPGIEEAIYNGWLIMNIDSQNLACIQVIQNFIWGNHSLCILYSIQT